MKAIIDEQLEEVLTKLGIWEDIISGNVCCVHCKKVVNANSLGVFIPRRNNDGSRRIDCYCNESECINSILNLK